MKIKLSKKEINLLRFVIDRTISYGWDSCLGGYEENDKRAIKKYDKEMKILEEILNKIN